MKKTIAFVLLCTVFISVFSTITAYASSKSSYSIKTGKELILDTRLKNATWGSDDVSVATVTKMGVVKGISVGTCTIVATANGESELFTVKVTKPKKKNTVELIQKKVGDEYYGPLSFKHVPIAYLAGNKVTFFETTFSELIKNLKGTGYSLSCEHEVNDIVAYDFQAAVMKGKDRVAWLRFKVTDSMLAKDAVASKVCVETAKSGFYYFNSAFKIKNIPLFEDFLESELFDKRINWIFEERNIDSVKQIVCQCTICYESDYSYVLEFYFDSATHKCLSVKMR